MEERPRRPEVRGEAAAVRGGSETKTNNAKTYVSYTHNVRISICGLFPFPFSLFTFCRTGCNTSSTSLSERAPGNNYRSRVRE